MNSKVLQSVESCEIYLVRIIRVLERIEGGKVFECVKGTGVFYVRIVRSLNELRALGCLLCDRKVRKELQLQGVCCENCKVFD